MAEAIKPHDKGTKQLFKNPIIEKLTRTHIAVPVSIFALYSAALLYWSIAYTSLSIGISVAMYAYGFVVFTWVEYQVHRHVFHMGTNTEWRKKTQYLIHGVHHEYPKDKDRLAMPPVASVTIGTVLLLLLRLVMGDFAFSFMPGFMTGYAYYLLIHYMVHAHQPPKNLFKWLWVNHSVHHYKNGKAVFGVTSPVWDFLYGTTADSLAIKNQNFSQK